MALLDLYGRSAVRWRIATRAEVDKWGGSGVLVFDRGFSVAEMFDLIDVCRRISFVGADFGILVRWCIKLYIITETERNSSSLCVWKEERYFD